MTELEATIGRVQLHKLPPLVKRRRQLVRMLRERIADLAADRLGKEIASVGPAYWFVVIKLDPANVRVSKDDFALAVRREGVPVVARYDHYNALDAPWLRDRRTFGNTPLPWSAAPRERIDYQELCP